MDRVHRRWRRSGFVYSGLLVAAPLSLSQDWVVVAVILGAIWGCIASLAWRGARTAENRRGTPGLIPLIDIGLSNPKSDRLVIFVHGFAPAGHMAQFVRTLAAHSSLVEGADIAVLDLGFYVGPRGFESMEEKIRETQMRIAAMHRRSNYDEIYFVAHSMGDLFVRRLLLDSIVSSDKGGCRSRHRWVERVDRVVILAGLGLGWEPDHRMNLRRAATFRLWIGLGKLPFLRRHATFRVRRGSPFISKLRHDWLDQSRDDQLTGNPRLPKMVQLLGSTDQLVPPGLSVDTVTAQSRWRYIAVPRTDHKHILGVQATRWISAEDAQRRILAIRRALEGPFESIDNEDAWLRDAVVPDETITDVVFVMHGIRDRGYWTEKLAATVERTIEREIAGSKVARVTSSYGYFPALSFLIPARRDRKASWFGEEWIRAKAQYPAARLHFVGHSNGTYLLARSLQRYPSMRFKRIVLAGSVVRQQYGWEQLRAGQVGAVLNFVGRDAVLAALSAPLSLLPFMRVGGAGWFGFTRPSERVVERTIGAGHGLGVSEEHWQEIADFIVGRPPPSNVSPWSASAGRRIWRSVLSVFAFALVVGALLLLGAGLWFIAGRAGFTGLRTAVVALGLFWVLRYL